MERAYRRGATEEGGRPPAPGPRRARRRAWRWALGALVVAELLARGPVRALRESRDLSVHFGAARVWVAGGNPYDMDQVGAAFVAGGGPPEERPTRAYMPSVYPPVTLALEAPLALVRWRVAVALFQAGSLALVLLALARLTREARLSGGAAALAVLGTLALAPLHTGLAAGQVAVPSAALLLLGWTLREERPAAAGVLMALGAALKPQLALPFLVAVAVAVRPSLGLLAAGLAVGGGLLGLGVARLHSAGVHSWLADWLALIRETAAPAGMNDVHPQAGGSIPMIHLEMLVRRLTASEAAAAALPLAATLPAAAFAAWRLRRARDRGAELLALSLLCVASLLAFYHRTYDALLLAAPIFAAVACARDLPGGLRYGLAACLATFLLPGAPALQVLADAGAVPAAVTGSAVWRGLVLPHQVWALLALELLLVLALARRASPSSRLDRPARSGDRSTRPCRP